MPIMKDGQLYGRRSRKNLEKWCKKLGLPIGKSSSSMEESLSSYFQKQKVQPRNQKDSDAPLDLTESSSANCSEAADVIFVKRRERSNMDSLDDSIQAHETSQGFFISQCTDRNMHHDRASSFEFHVASDDGIKLSVDLNYKPSDWVKKCNDEANVFGKKNFRRFHVESKKDGESSKLLGSQNNTNDGDLEPRVSIDLTEKSTLLTTDVNDDDTIKRKKTVCNGDKSLTMCSNGFLEHQVLSGNTLEKHLCEAESFVEKGQILDNDSSDFARENDKYVNYLPT